MPIDVELLSRICKEPGAPGFETRIRNVVLEELDGLADDVRVDAIGNVIALKRGRSSEMKSMAIGLAHSLSRYKLKFSPDKVDTMIVQAHMHGTCSRRL